MHAKSFQLCLTLCNSTDCTCQSPLSMGFSRQEYWSGLPGPPPGDLPDPEFKHPSLTSPAMMAGGFLTTNDTWEALWPQLPLLSSHPGIWNTFLNFRNIHFKNVCSVKLNPATYFHFPWGQVQIIDTGFTVCIHPLEYWLRGEGHKWDTKGNPFSWVWWRNSQCAGVAACKVRLAVLPEAGSHLFSSHWLSRSLGQTGGGMGSLLLAVYTAGLVLGSVGYWLDPLDTLMNLCLA